MCFNLPSTSSIDTRLANILSPFSVLYLFSATIASTSPKVYHKSLYFQIFYIFIYFLLSAIVWISVVNSFISSITMISYVIFTITYWALFLLSTVDYLEKFKKRRILKLINEIKTLYNILYDAAADSAIRNTKTSNTVYTMALVAFHTIVCVLDILVSLRADSDDGTGGKSHIPMVIVGAYFRLSTGSELLCLSCFVSILCCEADCFISYLRRLLKPEDVTQNIKNKDIVSCYRLLHRILNHINKIWQPKIFLIACLDFFFSMWIFMSETSKANMHNTSSFTLIPLLLSFYSFGLLILLGILGQKVANRLNEILLLATAIKDSDLKDATRLSGEHIVLLSGVYVNHLLVTGGTRVDGRLPLRVAVTIISAIIVLLQLGIK